MSQHRKRNIFKRMFNNWKLIQNKIYAYLVLVTFIILFIVAYFFHNIFISIYPGERGVLWSRFSGTDMVYLYEEGLHIIFPWNKMYIYDTRVQHTAYVFEALSKDGLSIKFELSVRYYPDRDKLPELHTLVGPNYPEKVVEPEVQAHLRKVVANYLPDEIYTSEGYILQIIMQGALGALAERHIVLDNLLIRRMVLPKRIQEAIESKLAQEQISLEYQFRLEREEKEAERKRIEAEGIRDFQELVKQGNFFDKYLTFKGIEATLELADSNNAKVVVIGGGKNSLPLIMNMDSGNNALQPQNSDSVSTKDLSKIPSNKIQSSTGSLQSPVFSKSLPAPATSNSSQTATPTPAPPASPQSNEQNLQSYQFNENADTGITHYLQTPLLSQYQGRISNQEPKMRVAGKPNPTPVPPPFLQTGQSGAAASSSTSADSNNTFQWTFPFGSFQNAAAPESQNQSANSTVQTQPNSPDGKQQETNGGQTQEKAQS